MDVRNDLFTVRGRKTIIGVVHLEPLPGTPLYKADSFENIRRQAVEDAVTLRDGGADACLIQTVDGVYSTADDCDPMRLAAITLIVSDVVKAVGGALSVGVQIMKNAVSASMAVAQATGADFIRASAWVGATNSPFGVVQAVPDRFAAYRKSIGAEHVRVIADIHSQHFRWLHGEIELHRIAHWAQQAGADAVCLGDPSVATCAKFAASLRSSVPSLPIILAGYTGPTTARAFLEHADGVFVGDCFKDPITQRIEKGRVQNYLEAIDHEIIR